MMKMIKYSAVAVGIGALLFFVVIPTRSSFADVSPANEYTFDSSSLNFSSNTASDSAGGSAATLVGFTSAGVTTGKIGQALEFSGSNSKGQTQAYVRLPSLPITFSGTSNFSIALWVDTAASVNQMILGKGTASGPIAVQLYDNSGRLEAVVGGSRQYIGATLPVNTWTHVVLTNNAQTGLATVYVNGAQVGQSFTSGTTTAPSADFLVGAFRNTSNSDTVLWTGFQGAIDDVQIYNSALSSSQIQALYQQTASSVGTAPTSGGSTSGSTGGSQDSGGDTNPTPPVTPPPSSDVFQIAVTPPVTVRIPLDSVHLNATTTMNGAPAGAPASWSEASGPTQTRITKYGSYGAIISGFEPGAYTFVARASAHNGALTISGTTTITVLSDSTQPGDVSFNADNFVPTYTGNFGYGSNPGYYANGWTSSDVYGLIAESGGHSMRSSQPDSYVSDYGMTFDLPSFKYADSAGLKDNVLLVGTPASSDQSTTTYDGLRSKLWQGIYLPIWDNGQNGTPINDSNAFAVYIYHLVKTYGPYIKFWEIVNEPDYTYAWSDAMANSSQDGNWWTSDPPPSNLVNMHAPVTAYIRVLRIAYEVIKKYDPSEYVCPGGLGYPSFLDAILRNTDNPDGGTVSSAYPLAGGAYFDCLSWHIYPQYSVSHWDNKLGVVYTRYSDYLANTLNTNNQAFLNVLDSYGYNGTKYPAKPVIVTENNVASKEIGDGATGGIVMQRNFAIKELVEAQRIGLMQMYWYQTGDTGDYDTASTPFDLMGLYDNLTDHAPGTESMTDEGVANLTTSDLLYGWTYDAAQSTKLNLPASVDGAAFSKNGQYRYVLWAKTSIDNSEAASATYSFPASLGLTSLNRIEWDYSTTHTSNSVNTSDIALTGSPSFFIPANQSLPLQGGGSTTPPPPPSSGNSSGGNTSGGNSSGGGSTSNEGNPSSQPGGSSIATSGGAGGILSTPPTQSATTPGQTNPTQTTTSTQGGTVAASMQVSITTPVLNVRSTPGGSVVGHVTPSDTGTVLWSSPATPWEEVSFSNGLSGFVYNTYLTQIGAGAGTTQTTATSTSSSGSLIGSKIIINTNSLRVRSAPTNGTVVGHVNTGDEGTVLLPPANDWVKVQFTNFSGYVYEPYTTLVSASSTTSTTGTATKQTLDITTPVLNVRTSPGGSVIGHVTPNDTGTLLSQSPTSLWIEASFTNGLTGYVDSEYTSLSTPSTNSVTVATATLHVRKTPNGTIIGKVHLGQQGTLISSTNGWSDVSFSTLTGYVSDAYISK